ncbi:MAG: PadR family transcriptional regulator [Alphaproteobacteria bacterium]
MLNVSTLCLGLLAHGEWTGYDIKRAFETGSFSHFFEASFGSIYPALAGLEKDGQVVSRTEMQDGRPNRKVYSITDEGRSEFTRRITAHKPQPDKYRSEFLVAMLFAAELGQARVAEILDSQLAQIEEGLAAIEQQTLDSDPQDKASAFVTDYGRHVLEASASYLREHRADALAAASATPHLSASPTATAIPHTRLAGKTRP